MMQWGGRAKQTAQKLGGHLAWIVIWALFFYALITLGTRHWPH